MRKVMHISISVMVTVILMVGALYFINPVSAETVNYCALPDAGDKCNVPEMIKPPMVCPANSTPLANGLCKDEPTGCLYGDNIPLDSLKCVEPNDIPVQVETSEPAKVSKCE